MILPQLGGTAPTNPDAYSVAGSMRVDTDAFAEFFTDTESYGTTKFRNRDGI